MRTGNVGQFFHHFHLISLFDIARSYRREEYRDYINEICRRAAEHGVGVWLDCWEPRLPAYAQALLPPDWGGSGGWPWHGRKDTAFCWEVPEGVAYWKSMARDAIASLPDLEGVVVSMIDNEAAFCDASCPTCNGRSLEKGILDIFSVFETIASERKQGGKSFRLAIYDWWLPPELVSKITGRLPEGSLVIGRSARGVEVGPPDHSWRGAISDISNVVDGVSPDFPQHCQSAKEKGLIPIDMVSWSRGMENFFLPGPPDPLFAIRKSRALVEAGAEGWMDYDCGSFDLGSVALGLRELDVDPAADEGILVERTLTAIWGERGAEAALNAYVLYRKAREWMPAGMPSEAVRCLDARSCGLGFTLFGPFLLDDFRFHDTTHAFNFFAPYNLLTGETLPLFARALGRVVPLLKDAFEVVRDLPSSENGAAKWERAVFEIHWRSFRAIDNYIRLASAKWDYNQGGIDGDTFRQRVREVASDELENLDGTEIWNTTHPGHLGNPCHRILGHMTESWPDADFSKGIFSPKRLSLEFLRDQFRPDELIPAYAILGTTCDNGGL